MIVFILLDSQIHCLTKRAQGENVNLVLDIRVGKNEHATSPFNLAYSLRKNQVLGLQKRAMSISALSALDYDCWS